MVRIKKKKLLSIILVLSLLSGIFSDIPKSEAATPTFFSCVVNGITYNFTKEKIGGVEYATNVYITSEVNQLNINVPTVLTDSSKKEYPVYSIGYYNASTEETRQFLNRDIIKSKEINITINGVKQINERAFRDCGEIKTVIIKGNDTIIGKQAFDGCYGISSLSLDSVKTIGDYAFNGCGNNNAFTVKIPETTQRIGYTAFQFGKYVTINVYNPNVEYPSDVNAGNFPFSSNKVRCYTDSSTNDLFAIKNAPKNKFLLLQNAYSFKCTIPTTALYGTEVSSYEEGTTPGVEKLNVTYFYVGNMCSTYNIRPQVSQTGHFTFKGYGTSKEDGANIFSYKNGEMKKVSTNIYNQLKEYKRTHPYIESVELIPIFTGTKYNINFHTNGGELEGDSNAISTYTFGTAHDLPQNIHRAGYTFVNWTTSFSHGAYVSNIPAGTSEAVDAYAHWKANSYKVSFDLDGGSGSTATKTVTFGDKLPALPDRITKKGYVFAGWTYGKMSMEKGMVMDIPNDIKLKANWIPVAKANAVIVGKEDDSVKNEPSDNVDYTKIQPAVTSGLYKASNTGEYYKGLNATEKHIYNAIYNFYRNGQNAFKKVNLSFSATSKADGETKIDNAIKAFVFDHVEYSWVVNNTYAYSFAKAEGRMYIKLQFLSGYNEQDTLSAMEAYRKNPAVFKKLVSSCGIKSKDSTITKYIKIQKAVVKQYHYPGLTKETEKDEEYMFSQRDYLYSLYKNNKSAICVGFAKTFSVLCNHFNLPVMYASGIASKDKEPHAWNYIKVNGKWYLVDTTFIDSAPTSDKYLLLGTKSSNKGKYVMNKTGKVLLKHVRFSKTNYTSSKNKKLLKYKVASFNKSEVAIVGLTKAGKSKTRISIPQTVNIGGLTYKVSAIRSGALKSKKLKTLTIKGKNMKKVAKCFSKKVKVKCTSKVKKAFMKKNKKNIAK